MPIVMVLSKFGLVDSDEAGASVEDADGTSLTGNSSTDPLAIGLAVLELGWVCLPVVNEVTRRERAIGGHEALREILLDVVSLTGFKVGLSWQAFGVFGR